MIVNHPDDMHHSFFLGFGSTFGIGGEGRDNDENPPEIILPRDVEHKCEFNQPVKPPLGFNIHATQVRKK